MARGRPALEGTKEAREFVTSGKLDIVINALEISTEAKVRILKAVKFGLGIKS